MFTLVVLSCGWVNLVRLLWVLLGLLMGLSFGLVLGCNCGSYVLGFGFVGCRLVSFVC